MLVVIADHPGVVRALADAGANIRLRDIARNNVYCGLTAMDMAKQMKRIQCVEILSVVIKMIQ